jgi:hypothetical protein
MNGLLKNSDFRLLQDLENLIGGDVMHKTLDESLVFSELHRSKSALWTLFVHGGYLTPETLFRNERGSFDSTLRIPNKEISIVYAQIVERWFFEHSGDEQDYKDFLKFLNEGKVDAFVAKIREYLSQSGSYFDFAKHTPECVFHAFMLGLLVGFKSKYHIKSNIESGLGRCDVLMIPKNAATHRGIILEFKTCTSEDQMEVQAEEALAQISQKRYGEGLQDVKEVLCIGLAFCGKNVVGRYDINKVEVLK